jgi:hypothetical protein
LKRIVNHCRSSMRSAVPDFPPPPIGLLFRLNCRPTPGPPPIRSEVVLFATDQGVPLCNYSRWQANATSHREPRHAVTCSTTATNVCLTSPAGGLSAPAGDALLCARASRFLSASAPQAFGGDSHRLHPG